MSKLKFEITKITKETSFVIEDFQVPEYTGGYDRDKFWEKFLEKHAITDQDDVLFHILDITRCHWSPKSENWPGMKIAIKNGKDTTEIVLPPGKTKCKAFDRGKGKAYSWTSSCLATSAIYEQVYRTNDGCDTETINGNWNGCTQYMSTLDGFNLKHYKSCTQAFNAWIKSIGVEARDAAITSLVNKAAAETIENRTSISSAYSLINLVRHLGGNEIVEADQVTFDAPKGN